MTEQLQSMTDALCSDAPADYSDLKVLMLNCTLTRSPNLSHTEALMNVARGIFEANDVEVDYLRPVDYEIPAGLAIFPAVLLSGTLSMQGIIDAQVMEPKKRKPNLRPRGYGENFATDRRTPWTH